VKDEGFKARTDAATVNSCRTRHAASQNSLWLGAPSWLTLVAKFSRSIEPVVNRLLLAGRNKQTDRCPSGEITSIFGRSTARMPAAEQNDCRDTKRFDQTIEWVKGTWNGSLCLFLRRSTNRGAVDMDWNRVEGNWKQLKGKVKEQSGKLTDDDLDVIAGNQDQLEGRLQHRYGYAKDQARREINDWYDRQKW